MSSQLATIAKNEISLIDNIQEKIELWKSTFAKGLTNDEFEIFKYACIRTGLDPIFKQIHPVKRKDAKLGRDVLTIQTGIDGFRLIADRTNKYSPGREYTYNYDEKGLLVSATAYIKKMTSDGTWHEVSASAFYSEYVQTKYDGSPMQFWLKMKHNQLGKCAEALALRKAFPADLSGIYTTEEMAQADIQMTDNVEVVEKKSNVQKIEVIEKKTISKQQVDVLSDILKKCSKNYQDKVSNNMKKLGFMSISDLNQDMYPKCLQKAIEEMKLYEELRKSLDEQLSNSEILEVVDA